MAEELHKDLIEYRKRLDDIFKLAKPILDLEELIKKVRQEVYILKHDLHKFIKNHPEMCDNNCPESDYCKFHVDGHCPKIKDDYTTFFWGPKSLYQLGNLINGCGPYDPNPYEERMKK